LSFVCHFQLSKFTSRKAHFFYDQWSVTYLVWFLATKAKSVVLTACLCLFFRLKFRPVNDNPYLHLPQEEDDDEEAIEMNPMYVYVLLTIQ